MFIYVGWNHFQGGLELSHPELKRRRGSGVRCHWRSVCDLQWHHSTPPRNFPCHCCAQVRTLRMCAEFKLAISRNQIEIWLRSGCDVDCRAVLIKYSPTTCMAAVDKVHSRHACAALSSSATCFQQVLLLCKWAGNAVACPLAKQHDLLKTGCTAGHAARN